MQSTLTPQETDPHDTFLIEPDVVLAARADHALPDPVHDALSRLAHRAAHTTPDLSVGVSGASARTATAPTPTVDTTFRATAVGTPTKLPGQRSAFAKWVRNTSIAFLFALCSAIAAQTWRHHSDTIKPMIASWMPPFVLALISPAATPAPAEPPDAAPIQAATADQAAPTPPAQPPDAGCRRRIDAVGAVTIGAVNGARYGSDESADRPAQGQYRATQGRPGTNVPRHCQSVRAKPAAPGCDAAAAAGCCRGAGAQAKAGISASAASHGDVAVAATIPGPFGTSTARAIAADAATASHSRIGWWSGGAAADAAAVTSGARQRSSNTGGSNQFVSDRPPSTTIAAPVT